MQHEPAPRPDGFDQNENSNTGDSLARRLADEAEVLARDLNVRYMVRKSREGGSVQNLTIEEIAHDAAARVRKMYPVGYSNAGIVEAVRFILAGHD